MMMHERIMRVRNERPGLLRRTCNPIESSRMLERSYGTSASANHHHRSAQLTRINRADRLHVYETSCASMCVWPRDSSRVTGIPGQENSTYQHHVVFATNLLAIALRKLRVRVFISRGQRTSLISHGNGSPSREPSSTARAANKQPTYSANEAHPATNSHPCALRIANGHLLQTLPRGIQSAGRFLLRRLGVEGIHFHRSSARRTIRRGLSDGGIEEVCHQEFLNSFLNTDP